ncbi:MAG: CDP-archaeol synthase [Clostridia bacterium]|nr:CDP-archaeol synthase [Clostridia bacterium]
MKARVLTGLIGGIAAILIMLFLPIWVTRVCTTLLCMIAMYELLKLIGLWKHRSISAVSLLFAASMSFLDLLPDPLWMIGIVSLYVLAMVCLQIVYNQSVSFQKTAFLICTTLAIVFPIAFLAQLAALPDHGRAYIFYALIIAWTADMGAYFAGTFFGKHKLCPLISPKKTVEGFFGGMVSSMLCSLLGALIYQLVVLNPQDLQVSYWQVALIAFVLSPVSVVGDLICSVIKRQNGIKDFGNIFPGHGGVLDRFDSLMFIAPMLYVLCSHIPLVSPM